MSAAPDHVLITGASRGIGAALARAYAEPGRRLGLTGRDATALEAVADTARGCGAEVTTTVLDIRDFAAVQHWVETAEAGAPVDLAVANAGINRADDPPGIAPSNLEELVATNLMGTAHLVSAVLPAMLARGRGQLALVSSLAGIQGFGGMASYGATKAGIRAYGQALRGDLRAKGIRVSVVCPGFVDTAMAAQVQGSKIGQWDVDRAARFIRRGLARDRGLVAFPPLEALGVRILGLLPGLLLDPISRTFRYRVGER